MGSKTLGELFKIGLLAGSCIVLCARCEAQTDELTFTLAPGLKIEQVAGEPLVKWPVLADWDFQGRLVVVESAGVSKPVVKHNEQLLHRIVRLIDEDGDGLMDRRMVAADNLPFSEGVLCLGNDLLVAAPPQIWKLSDQDGDGYCESREVWFDGQTLTGCANDLHGPYLGRDGWVYWCKGAFAKQEHQLIGGRTLTDGAAHIHRRRYFGGPVASMTDSLIEPVMSGGMDNPVEVASLPNGERFFTSTFLVHPQDGKRDGVAHAIYGGAYGKEHDALNGIVRTGSLMPIMAQMGAVAPSGLACLESPSLLQTTSPTLVAALFNMQRVTALTLTPSGATYQAHPVDLAIGSRIDFHPTDILEDADGSLLVVDTGGWYDLCCPTSRVAQFTAPGGIYRIRSAESSSDRLKKGAIDWSTTTPDQVVQLLSDPRPWVARQALIKIASSGDWATESLRATLKQNNVPLSARIAALWALGAAGTPGSLESVARQLTKKSTDRDQVALQHAACNLVALHRYRPARPAIEALIKSSCESKQFGLARAAIEAIGKIGDEASARFLFEFAETKVDRVFDHSLRYALFELNSPSTVAPFLESSVVAQRSMALSTLDLLRADDLLPTTKLVQAAQDESLSVVATGLLVNRPQDADAVLRLLGPQWQSMMQRAESPPALFQGLATGWRDQTTWHKFIASVFAPSEVNKVGPWQEVVLQSRSGTTLPPSWFPWIIDFLQRDPVRVAGILERINLSAADQQPIVEQLVSLVHNQNSIPIKRQLLVSLPPKPLCDDQSLVRELAGSLGDLIERAEPSEVVWKSLKRLKLSPADAARIVALMPKLSPSELIQAVELVASLRDDSVDKKMLNQLVSLKAARAVPTNSFINVYRDRSADVRQLANDVANQLQQSAPEVQQTIQALIETLPPGDQVRGLTLYHSSKANCGACHQMGYRGGRIGPELSKIGNSRTRAAILEAVLFPSQRIEQGFDSTRVLTIDGRVFNGIVLTRTDKELSLRVSADKVEVIPLSEIEQQQASDVSIMPAGMLELLSPQEIADLLSLFESAK